MISVYTLKSWLADCINTYHSFESTGNPAIPYISAWKEKGGEIWYEFVGHGLIELLGCKRSDAARVFRKSLLDRRIYKYLDRDEGIEKEIFNKRQLNKKRRALREDVKEKGIIDAVYKLSLGSGRIIWLKDQAYVQSYEQDDLYLSFGSLTVVTKEMRAEEERVMREKLQALLETAGAICHELNQPIQAASGYSEVLLMKLEKDDPSYEKIKKISKMTKKMGNITKKLMRTTRYETKEYLKGFKIVDIDRSSKDENDLP
jgi:signal transduction histidine kinase